MMRLIEETDVDDARSKKGKRMQNEIPYPSEAIAELLVRDSLGAARLRKLRAGGNLRLILLAPDPDLIDDLARAVEYLAPGKSRVVVSERGKRGNVTEDLSALVGASGGMPSIHVAADLSVVPTAFQAVAEATLRIGKVDGPLVRRAMSHCCRGRPPKSVISLDLGRVKFKVVCACMPRGASAAAAARILAMVARDAAVAGPDSWLPDLVDCHEYGAAREWGLRVMRDIADWKKGLIPGRQLDTSALLVSDPGFGKTFFARILAKSMGVNLVQIGLGDLFKTDGHLHNTMAALRSVFADAKAKAPSVLFIDELDSFPRRGTSDNNDGYFTALVNELLALVDGASTDMAGVVLLAATNRPENIDPALLRKGRFSTHVHISRPGRRGVEHILRVHLQEDLVDVDISGAANLCTGATPAEIASWVKVARSYARRYGRPLREDDICRTVLGEAPVSVTDLRKTATHEAGHALASHLLNYPLGKVEYVTTISSSVAGGHAAFADLGDRLVGRRRLEEAVVVLLAGRASEELVFGDQSSAGAGGAEGSDLFRATAILASMETSYGMRGNLAWRSSPEAAHKLLAVDIVLRATVESRLQELHAEARKILGDWRDALDTVVEALVERRVLEGAEVTRIISDTAKARLGSLGSFESSLLPVPRVPGSNRQNQRQDTE